MVLMNEKITVDQIEKMLWEMTGYKADQSQVDAFKVLVQTLALEKAGFWKKAPVELVEEHVATLVTLARQLLDTGGRMRLHPEGQLDVPENPVATRADVEALGRKIIDIDAHLQDFQTTNVAVPEPLMVQNPAALYLAKLLQDQPMQQLADDDDRIAQWELDLIREQEKRQLDAADEITQLTEGWDDPPVLDEETREAVTEALTPRRKRAKAVTVVRKRRPAADLNPDGTLTCMNCGEAKKTSEYFRNKKSKTGFETRCRTCRSAKAA
jgi:hypothetical protein